MDIYNTSIEVIKSVGETRKKILNGIGIYTLYDLITYFPRTYEDRTKLSKLIESRHGETILFKAKVISNTNIKRVRKNLTIYSVNVCDDTESVNITWFNNKYMNLEYGKNYIFYGKCTENFGRVIYESPKIYPEKDLDKVKGFYPIYNLTKGLTAGYIQTLIYNLLKSEKVEILETLDKDILDKYNLCSYREAIDIIHKPNNYEEINKAKNRLIFEELFMMCVAMQILKDQNNKKGKVYTKTDISPFLNLLPYELTNAQKRVVNEISNDMKNENILNRMIQGDVGSGKTIVAAISMYIAYINGYQSAMMAPTTILANQHYLELKTYFDKLNIKTEILTSKTTKKNKKIIIEKLKNKEIDILFSTHSVIEEDVKFNNLGLVITDEQHRFGVRQRIKLSDKGDKVDVLVMSATPIPRTLALMIYGDLDLSIIDELPKGRKEIETFLVNSTYEERINSFIAKEIDNKHQVYIVCNLVSDSEVLDELKSVETAYEEYRKKLDTKYTISYIHGKMKQKEKDEIMEKYKNKEIDILISTTVIEVGINVPNATVMIIENADRFGLATLHQLRGRVGRGADKSYCILKSDNKSKQSKERLNILVSTNNGFIIGEKDLEIRGPGDFLGTKQHGLPEFKIASLISDIKILKEAVEASKYITDKNKYLKNNINFKNKLISIYRSNLENLGI